MIMALDRTKTLGRVVVRAGRLLTPMACVPCVLERRVLGELPYEVGATLGDPTRFDRFGSDGA
jgi:hypothetical protein